MRQLPLMRETNSTLLKIKKIETFRQGIKIHCKSSNFFLDNERKKMAFIFGENRVAREGKGWGKDKGSSGEIYAILGRFRPEMLFCGRNLCIFG